MLFVAPVSEELLFRGFLLPALAQSRLGFWGGAILTDALWTGLHAAQGNLAMVSHFLTGLMLSFLLWRTGSIRTVIFGHALSNLWPAAHLVLFAG